MIGDLPQLSTSSYAATAYGVGEDAGLKLAAIKLAANSARPAGQAIHQLMGGSTGGRALDTHEQNTLKTSNPEIPMSVSCRFIRVLIVDPDENVPLDKRVLFKGEERFTDLTDQELFFEVDIKTILAAHNAERVKIVNKKVKERTEYLEPAKIRELKMVVVNIASF